MSNANEVIEPTVDIDETDDLLLRHGLKAVSKLEHLLHLVSTKFYEAQSKATESLTVIERQIFVGQYIDLIREEEPFLSGMVNEEDAVQKISEDTYEFRRFVDAVNYRNTFEREIEEAAKK